MHRNRQNRGVSYWALACAVCSAVTLWNTACGSDRRSPGSPSSRAGSSSLNDFIPTNTDVDAGAGSGGSAGGQHSDAGPTGNQDADAASPFVPSCGNGRVEGDEQCDGFATLCRDLGFDSGEATCSPSCEWDTSACVGDEQCSDGRDNDGDSAVDCADSDCSAACQDACTAPQLLPLQTTFSGTTAGRSSGSTASCSDAAGGPTVVYRVETDEIARLDLTLSSAHDLTLSVAYACGDVPNELACGENTRLSMNVEDGEVYYVTVQGETAADEGPFLLQIGTRQPYCGDGFRDEEDDEACDDGNSIDGDGCDPDCEVESSENEPANDSIGDAQTLGLEPWYGEIRPAGDQDYLSVELTAGSSSLVVSTKSLGDGACDFNLMDTTVEILDTDANGNALIISDDNSGAGRCSLAVANGLPPGTYYLRVAAAAQAQPPTFPYELQVQVSECGDNTRGPGEACDDGNLTPGDGCSPSCLLESQ